MHTKEMIMDALQELYDEYDPVIQNYMYRGPMEKIPSFTFKQIAKKVPRSIPTIRKWCHVLKKEKLVDMRFKRSYSANDSPTYEVIRIDFKPIQLINDPLSIQNKVETFLKKYGG